MDPNLTDRQKEILTFILSSHEEQGYFPSLREIAAHFQLSLGTVQSHLDTLKRKGALDWDKGKSRALKVSPIHMGLRPMKALAGALDAFIHVPILGRVSAGPGLLAEENVEDTLTLPRNFFHYQLGEVFGLKVRGDSMIGAGILENDIVLVKRQSTAEEHEIVVALLGEEATVKYFHREGGRFFLVSANPAFPPREVKEDFHILGKVVHLMRAY
jgi:repressor LexA